MYALINIDQGLVQDYDNDNDYNDATADDDGNINGGGIVNDDGNNL